MKNNNERTMSRRSVQVDLALELPFKMALGVPWIASNVATSRLSIFRGFCLIDFSGKVASKSPNWYKMASKS